MDRRRDLACTEHVPHVVGDPGPLVVLVHGSLDRSASFSRVLRRLRDLHTLVFDRRGYHRSRDALPINTSLDGHVDDLLAIVDGRPAVVVGSSYGGDVALGAALAPGGPSPILAVAAFEPPMPWLGEWARRPGTTPAGRPVRGTGDPAWDTDPAMAAERFFKRMVGDDAWQRLPERAKAARRADGPALAAELAAIRSGEPPFDVADLAVPLVVGRGERSAPHQRATVGWLADHVPGARLVEIEGAGHGAHLSHPDAFAGLVRTTVTCATTPAGDVR